MEADRKLVVLASGNGSNFQAIIDRIKEGSLDAEVAGLITDREDAKVRGRARDADIPEFFINAKDKDRMTFDRELAAIIDRLRPGLIVLAGFMRILSPWFVRRYRGRIINIHPALLPSFPGAHAYEDAWNAGAKVAGCTVHFVDEGVDSGPIIIQRLNIRREDDTLESFTKRGLSIEHETYPEAIGLVLDGRIRLEGERVHISDERT
ncbi:MAG: phosphoribosylglycinamide formyltransferase [DPANN group archaeon]|nr:phosphoribosylglycinamide formyltransferase [DPANN group archaeon]